VVFTLLGIVYLFTESTNPAVKICRSGRASLTDRRFETTDSNWKQWRYQSILFWNCGISIRTSTEL